MRVLDISLMFVCAENLKLFFFFHLYVYINFGHSIFNKTRSNVGMSNGLCKLTFKHVLVFNFHFCCSVQTFCGMQNYQTIRSWNKIIYYLNTKLYLSWKSKKIFVYYYVMWYELWYFRIYKYYNFNSIENNRNILWSTIMRRCRKPFLQYDL